MEIKAKTINEAATASLGNLKPADAEIMEKALRGTGDNNASIKANAFTVLLSPNIFTIETTITRQGKKEPLKYPAAKVAYFSQKDNAFLGVGTISTNSLTRSVYPNPGEATEPIAVVANANDFGENAVQMIEKMYNDEFCVSFAETRKAFSPAFVDGTMTYQADKVVIRDKALFKIEPIPAPVKTYLATE